MHHLPDTRSPAPDTVLRSEPLDDSEQYRIQIIGGSVTNGGVLTPHDQAISELLEKELTDAGMDVEVLNASAGSWGIENQLAYLQRFGHFDSDLLIT